MKVIKTLLSFFKGAFSGIKVFWKVDDNLPNTNEESASSSDVISVDIPSVIDALTRSGQGNALSHSYSKITYPTSLIILDIIWFCHDKRFIIKGTEDMIKEYNNYLFHIKGFLIGEILAGFICFLSGLIINFIL